MPRSRTQNLSDEELIEHLRAGRGHRVIFKITGITVDQYRINALRLKHGIAPSRAGRVPRLPDETIVEHLRNGEGVERVRQLVGMKICPKRLRALRLKHNLPTPTSGSRHNIKVSDEMLRAAVIEGIGISVYRSRYGVAPSQKRLIGMYQEMGRSGPARAGGKSSRRAVEQRGANLYSEVRASLSHMTDPMLKDDAASEICLAILDGKLTLADFKASARKYSGAQVGEWRSRHRLVSLDEVRFEEGDATMMDMVEDESALAAFDAIFDEEEELIGSD